MDRCVTFADFNDKCEQVMSCFLLLPEKMPIINHYIY